MNEGKKLITEISRLAGASRCAAGLLRRGGRSCLGQRGSGAERRGSHERGESKTAHEAILPNFYWYEFNR
jgi:hypothetical protein